MAAFTVDGAIEYAEQIFDYNFDQDGNRRGEFYFVVGENPRIGGIGTTVMDFKRVYCNERIHNYDQPYPAETRRRYTHALIDAPQCQREIYRQTIEADEEFRKTLIKYQECMVPKEKRNIEIHSGPKAGCVGHVVVNNPLHRYLQVMDNEGDVFRTTAECVRVENPLQYMSGRVCCHDCDNIFEEFKHSGMVWVVEMYGKFNRPLCMMCQDYYMENGVLSMDREVWENKTGPFIYGQDQPASRIHEPGLLPLHSVLYHEGSSRVTERGRRRLPSSSQRRGL